MKTGLGFASGLLVLALAASALMQVPASAPPLARFVPSGPLLVLEARDFSSLLAGWNASREKPLWLESANYQVFSRSKLFLRLQEAHKEFTAAAGFTPDMSLLESIAGAESVLALYDVGKIEFLYITKLPSARRLQSILWQTRASFEPRNVAGSAYYVRVEPKSGRIIAFAATDDYLLLATSEDPLAGALKLLAGQSGTPVTESGTPVTESGTPVTGQPWYADGVQAAGQPGELRMVLDMGAIVRSPHFRSYWIQQNVSELRQYRAAVSDLHRRADEIRERRVFLRPAATDGAEPRPEQSSLVAELTRLAGGDSGLYRVWSAPKLEDTVTLLERKILARRTGRSPAPNVAPTVVLSGGRVGSEAALETRIDEPPPAPLQGVFSAEPLRVILERAGLKAVLHAQSSRPLSDSVFFGDESLIVLLADSDWNLGQAREALAGSVRGLWTASGLGAQWTDRNQDGETYWELNGLTPLLAAARGKHLFVANTAEPLLAALRRMAAPAAGPAAGYAAAFRHARESGNYRRFMGQLDSLQIRRYGSSPNQSPQFFSENVGSLSTTLARVREVSLRTEDRGDTVIQTVTYELDQ